MLHLSQCRVMLMEAIPAKVLLREVRVGGAALRRMFGDGGRDDGRDGSRDDGRDGGRGEDCEEGCDGGCGEGCGRKLRNRPP